MSRRQRVVVDERDIIPNRPVKPVRGRQPKRRPAKPLTPEQQYPDWDWENKPWGPPLEPPSLAPARVRRV